MAKSHDSVLFVGDCSFWAEQAHEFLVHNFRSVTPVFWEKGKPGASTVTEWDGDWILSFKSDLLLDGETLAAARKGAINFHPSAPKYRGIGGYHYAIDNRDTEFAATCHHMDERIDHGPIIETRRFTLSPNETVELLQQRTAANCLILFYEICQLILDGSPLPRSDECWGPILFTRTALQAYLRNKAERAVAQFET